MKRPLLFLNIFLFFFCLQAYPQTGQSVTAGNLTGAISFPSGGCVYNWVNDNPSIGLPAGGTGDISSFTAVNNGRRAIVATIMAEPGPTGDAFLGSSGIANISMFNIVNGNKGNTISTFGNAYGIGYCPKSPTGSLLYEVNPDKGNVQMFDGTTYVQRATQLVGLNPHCVVFSPDGYRGYVTSGSRDNISVINTALCNVITTISVGANPWGIVISPDGNTVYVANHDDNTVSVVSVSANAEIAKIPVGLAPTNLTVSQDGGEVFVTNYNSNNVSVINSSTNSVIAIIPVGTGPLGISVTPAGNRVFVSNYSDGTVSVINTSTNAVVSVIPTGRNPNGVLVSPGGTQVYVINQGSNSMSVINTGTNRIISNINVGSSPFAIGDFIKWDAACAPVKFTITVNPANAAPPTITTSAGTGTISACTGTASSSPNIQQFIVSGSNLTNDVNLAAPNNFEISLNQANGFGTNLTLPQNGGSVNNTVIYVRSSAGASSPGVSGNVSITSTGAQPAKVPVTAVVNALPTVNTVFSQTVNNGQPVAAVSFTGTGNIFNWVNDTPGIGLTASGTGDIEIFNAVNKGTTAVKATITATPVSGSFAYIGNNAMKGNDFTTPQTISVINTATGIVVSTITVGVSPMGVSVTPDGKWVYVANEFSNNVSVINASVNKVVATVPVGINPAGIAVTPNGKFIYVANLNSNNISVISTASNKVVATITVGTTPQNGPGRIVMSPDGNFAYVTYFTSPTAAGHITAINTVTNSVSATIPLPTGGIDDMAISPDGSRLYVPDYLAQLIYIVDLKTQLVTAAVKTPASPVGIAVSPDGNFFYVTESNFNNVLVISTASNSIVATISVGQNPNAISVTSDGKYVYVQNTFSNNVSVISSLTNKVINRIPVGGGPEGYGNFISPGTGCTGLPAKFTITVNPDPAAVPTITTGSTTGDIVACLAVASVSPYIEQFAVSGTNLTGDITVSGVGSQFEISLNPNSGYGASVTIPQAGGLVSNVIVYARAAAAGNSGSLTGMVRLTSPGALPVNAGLTGLINGLPNMGGVATQTFVGGQTTSPINFVTNGNNVSWTNSNAGIGLAASGTGNILPFTAVNNSGIPITAEIIATPVSPVGGCTGTPISFIVTVNPAPATVPTITTSNPTGTIIACLGQASLSPNIEQFTVYATKLTADIIATVSSGFEISLNAGSGYGSSITIPQTSGIVNNVIVYVRAAATTSSGNLTGIVKLSSTGAQPVNAGVTGVVNGLPTMGGVSPQLYVNGDVTTGVNFTDNGNTINWTNDSPGIGLAASGTGNIPPFTTVNTGTTAIKATITATPVAPGTGCTGTPITFNITVSPTLPSSIAVAGPLSPLNTIYGTPSTSTVFSVVGTSLTQGILVIPPVGFEVSSNDVAFAGSLMISSSGTQVYIRLAATTHVGSYSGKIILSSVGAPSASLDMPLSTVTPAPLTIAADNKTKTVGTANPELTATYIGFLNGDTPADLTSPVILSTIADITSPIGVYPITLSGYVSKDYTITPFPGILTVIGAIVIPNTFTPNGDGVNDTWNIKYLNVYNSCTVQIFTRYGENVYSSIGYGTPWDGTYKGAKLPTGTYYYVINLKNDTKPLSGFIAIIR
ncbi:beta-propeller fold lactonase family protein [Mucilaginibacter sp.]|uniref:YVTN family beta-propeller repeat protein n=1 Tax=Mucilaginibacter sp. TaxID=1882438 RepID=UPI0028439C47|nr:beta-propeller fold lactonase family protein [Mucilaginibacter sp.]MDR3696012.1 beta-propeller fold lactonase family protein [Mucilaginibacter sp.]